MTTIDDLINSFFGGKIHSLEIEREDDGKITVESKEAAHVNGQAPFVIKTLYIFNRNHALTEAYQKREDEYAPMNIPSSRYSYGPGGGEKKQLTKEEQKAKELKALFKAIEKAGVKKDTAKQVSFGNKVKKGTKEALLQGFNGKNLIVSWVGRKELVEIPIKGLSWFDRSGYVAFYT